MTLPDCLMTKPPVRAIVIMTSRQPRVGDNEKPAHLLCVMIDRTTDLQALEASP